MFNKLDSIGFFPEKEVLNDNEERHYRIDVNKGTGLIVETNKKSIKETYSLINYSHNSLKNKEYKLYTIQLVPKAIEEGKVVSDNIMPTHKKGLNKSFANIEYECEINGIPILMRLSIKKGLHKNKFWVHYIFTKNITDSNPSKGIDANDLGEKSFGDNDIVTQPIENSNSKSEIDGKKSKDDAFVVTDDGDLFFGKENGALDEVNPDDELGRTYGEIIEDEVNAGNSSRIDIRRLSNSRRSLAT